MPSLKDIEVCRDELNACRTGSPKEKSAILKTFQKLSTLHVDTEALRLTGIGKEANDKFFRNHEDAQVREACTKLILAWKAVALGNTSGPAASADASANAKAQDSKDAKSKDSKDAKAKDSKDAKEKRKAGAVKEKAEGKAKRSKHEGGLNEDLIGQFRELASYEFKNGSKFAGIAFNKVVAVLQGLEEKVSSGSAIAHLPGIGKETVKKIDQYLEKGIIDKLEKIRNGEAT
ncbi:unnamed protein product [Effrenium voratum]|uniref:TFIIS N-terminal domain-containing protein n=1 Tax=Effrenium voratum TaxID=2562239 RepID=A0AA36I3N5_9DINO|nr:unnamed protein product [Effrenium voratum]